MDVTAVATHPEVAPSTRFRIHQFKAALAEREIRVRYEFLFEMDEYRRLRAGAGVWARAKDLYGATRPPRGKDGGGGIGDVVWVSRDLGPVAAGGMLSRLAERGVPVVSDFDDAVYLSPQGGSRWLAPIRRPGRSFRDLCRASRIVLAGSSYLAAQARHVLEHPDTRDVRVLPTVVDTTRFRPSTEVAPSRGHGDRLPVLGWVGSHSTMPYLWARRTALRDLAARIDFKLRVVSDVPPPPFPGVNVEFRRWTPASEVAVFQGLDVGLYPLPDDHWTRGKCGFKAIQYGACGIPVVCSPVGVLTEIVVPEETGLWAETDLEWVRCLEDLLRDGEKARAMGRSARARVEDLYSLSAALPILESALRDAAGREPAGRLDAKNACLDEPPALERPCAALQES